MYVPHVVVPSRDPATVDSASAWSARSIPAAAALVEELGLDGETHQGPDRVDEVEDEDRHDDGHESPRQRGGDIEREEGRPRVRRGAEHALGSGRDAGQEREPAGRQDPDQDRARDSRQHEEDDQPHTREPHDHGRVVEVARRDRRRGRPRHDDAHRRQTDECQEESDSDRERDPEAFGDRLREPGSRAEEGQHGESDPAHEDRAESGLPGVPIPWTTVRDERVLSHVGRDRERAVRPESHEEGSKAALRIVATIDGPRDPPHQDLGVHDDDVAIVANVVVPATISWRQVVPERAVEGRRSASHAR